MPRARCAITEAGPGRAPTRRRRQDGVGRGPGDRARAGASRCSPPSRCWLASRSWRCGTPADAPCRGPDRAASGLTEPHRTHRRLEGEMPHLPPATPTTIRSRSPPMPRATRPAPSSTTRSPWSPPAPTARPSTTTCGRSPRPCPALPAPARTRDFRLTPEQAASLRPAGWRRLLAPFAGPKFAFAGPLGAGLATLGLAGILVAGSFGVPLAATAPADGGAAAASDAVAVEMAPQMAPGSAAAASTAPVELRAPYAAVPSPDASPVAGRGRRHRRRGPVRRPQDDRRRVPR